MMIAPTLVYWAETLLETLAAEETIKQISIISTWVLKAAGWRKNPTSNRYR
jgi:hypothetical protein